MHGAWCMLHGAWCMVHSAWWRDEQRTDLVVCVLLNSEGLFRQGCCFVLCTQWMDAETHNIPPGE